VSGPPGQGRGSAEEQVSTCIWSDKVVALVDVLDETGVGGFPAQELLGDRAGSGHVSAEQVREDAAELFSRERSDGKVQVRTDTPSSPTAWSTAPAGACSTASR
jgi:hypothetical protein